MDEKNIFSDENIDGMPPEMEPAQAAPERETAVHERSRSSASLKTEPLAWLERGEIDQSRSRWSSIQAQFIDQPRGAVEQAEALVAETIEKICRSLTEQQTRLSEQWCTNEAASTEDLRLTLQNYRSFLEHLLDH